MPPTILDHHGDCGEFVCEIPAIRVFKFFGGRGEEGSRSFQNRFEGARTEAKVVDDTACFLHSLILRRVVPNRPAGLRHPITQSEWLKRQAESKRLSGKGGIIRQQNPPGVPTPLVYIIILYSLLIELFAPSLSALHMIRGPLDGSCSRDLSRTSPTGARPTPSIAEYHADLGGGELKWRSTPLTVGGAAAAPAAARCAACSVQ